MQITKKSQYALRAMIVLAKRKKEVQSLRFISKEENISFDYLEKIFSKLEKGGLVKSKRGAAGGYLLSRAPAKITIKDIFDAVGEPVFIVDCIGKKCPRDDICRASRAWKKINKTVEESLSSIKLSTLIK